MLSEEQKKELLYRMWLYRVIVAFTILCGLMFAWAEFDWRGITLNLFLLVGVFSVAVSVVIHLTRDAARADSYGMPTWLAPKRGDDWSRGIIRAGRKAANIQEFAAGAAFVVVFGGLALATTNSTYRLVLIAAVGLVLALLVFRLITKLKFGPSTLVAAHPLPVRLGDEFSGTIRTSLPTVPEDGVSLKLSCIHSWKSNTGTGRNWKCLWQEQHDVPRQFLHTGAPTVQIPFKFSVPGDATPSQAPGYYQTIAWQLEVSASLPGPDFYIKFDVPVFDRANAEESSVGSSALSPFR
jgi:hypothetical protein